MRNSSASAIAFLPAKLSTAVQSPAPAGPASALSRHADSGRASTVAADAWNSANRATGTTNRPSAHASVLSRYDA
jgi:hypothetical protein